MSAKTIFPSTQLKCFEYCTLFLSIKVTQLSRFLMPCTSNIWRLKWCIGSAGNNIIKRNINYIINYKYKLYKLLYCEQISCCYTFQLPTYETVTRDSSAFPSSSAQPSATHARLSNLDNSNINGNFKNNYQAAKIIPSGLDIFTFSQRSCSVSPFIKLVIT